jgi:hypothetical protein
MYIKKILDRRIWYLISIVIVFMLFGCTTPSSDLDCPSDSLVEIPSKPEDWHTEIFTPTDIEIKKGDTLSFTASGSWNLGLGPVGPNGKDDWCECTINEPSGEGFRGPVGALIGRIGNQGSPFLIGSQNIVTADADGILYLGSNENMGPCNNEDRGSCYEDNRGTMDVCIEIR